MLTIRRSINTGRDPSRESITTAIAIIERNIWAVLTRYRRDPQRIEIVIDRTTGFTIVAARVVA